LEFTRRHLVSALIGVAALALSAAVALRPRPDQVVGHAFPIPSAQDRIQVEVLNGTVRPGVARTVTRVLRRQGLDVVFFGNTDAVAHLDSTRILVRRGAAAAGHRVARALGYGKVVIQPDTLRRVNVSVVVGDDYRPPAELHP
jgi:hypothetical protein